MGFSLCCLISLEVTAQSPEAKIMPLGDSITRGTNDINWPNGSIPGGYRKELGIRLASGGFTYDFVGGSTENAAVGMDPDHEGRNGLSTSQVLSNLPTSLTAAPDVVLLHIGTNDILNNISVSTAAANLGAIINAITVNAPNRRLYVATILPITQAWPPPPQQPLYTAATLNGNANAYNVQVRNLVTQYANLGRKVYLVEMNGGIVLTNTNPLLNFYQPGDGVHPGQAGYDQMGVIWANAVTSGGSFFPPPPVGAPASPGTVTTTVVSGTIINLSWLDNSSNETSFELFSKVGYSGSWQQIATLPANTTAYSATGLQTGANPHYFALRTVNASGSSAWSNVASSIPANVALNKTATASTEYSAAYVAPKANNGNVNEFWSATDNDPSARWDVDLAGNFRIHRLELVSRQDSDKPDARRNFEIRASNDPSFATYTILASQGEPALAHTSTLGVNTNPLTPFRYIKVAKTDGRYFSFAEMRVFGAVPPPVPATPGTPTFPETGKHEVHVTWTDNSTNEASFKLERKTGSNGTFAQIAIVPANNTSFVDIGLNPGIEYFYRLRSTNGVDDSAFSGEAAATTSTYTGYQLWATNYPLFLALPPADQAPTADPNNDGIINLLACALGLNPLAIAPVGALPAVTPPPAPAFQFRRNITSGMTYEVLVSTDLSPAGWQIRSQSGAIVTTIPGESGVEMVTVPLEPAGSQNFARLRVIQN